MIRQDGEPVTDRELGEEDDGDITYEQRERGIRRMKADIALAKRPDLAIVEERLYQHVLDCIDFGALSSVEQMLWQILERAGAGALDNEHGLSRRLIERALFRAAHDPTTAFSYVPEGITRDEERAVRYDPACLLCEWDDHEAVSKATAADTPVHQDDDCDCPVCDEMARDWRTKHAEQLRAQTARREAIARKRAEAARRNARKR